MLVGRDAVLRVHSEGDAPFQAMGRKYPEGYVDVDINRGKNLPAKMTAKLDSGQYVLVDSVGTVYQLDDRASAQKFTGKNVKIS